MTEVGPPNVLVYCRFFNNGRDCTPTLKCLIIEYSLETYDHTIAEILTVLFVGSEF